jgi:hypothetical protein
MAHLGFIVRKPALLPGEPRGKDDMECEVRE